MHKQGLAKAQFIDLYQRTPWHLKKTKDAGSATWPFFQSLLKQQRIGFLEFFLVHHLLKNFIDPTENTALFLAHLILASKQGHLCIQVNQETITPSTIQLWQNEEGEPLRPEEAEELNQRVLIGAAEMPEALLSHSNESGISNNVKPIFQNHHYYYLQKHWVFETLFLKSLKSHLSHSPSLKINKQQLQTTLETLIESKVLLKEQAQAIEKSCLKALTLVTGGPGTGKTYTAGHLIKIFWNQLEPESRSSCQIILAAPTGKAAMNLQESLSRLTSELTDFPPLQAKTLHSLLNINPYSSDKTNTRLMADFIVIDESSMIDVKIMSSLFESVKPGARLVLLGDQHQLPSVEAGSIFADLVELNEQFPQTEMACVKLSICLRAELASLIDFAQLINEGKGESVLAYLNGNNHPGVSRLKLPEGKHEAQKALVDYAASLFPSIISPSEPEQLIKMFQAIRVLSPMRKGLFGVEMLNRLIWEKISSRITKEGFIAIPIIITNNDYQQELFNGETGVLIRKLPLQSLDASSYALFSNRQANMPVRRQPAFLLPKYEYAYCLSIHKSQGTAFDALILALPEGSDVFGRELFYTAVTRARELVEVYGSDRVILKTVQKKGFRLSGIQARFLS